MTSAENPNPELKELQAELFSDATLSLPKSFLPAFQKLSEGASARVGVYAQADGEVKHTAYWLKGHMLGVLSCVGLANPTPSPEDAAAVIRGHFVSLDAASVDVEVVTNHNQGQTHWGLVLTIHDGEEEIVLSAAPDTVDEPRIGPFIDHIVDKLSAVPSVSVRNFPGIRRRG